jgi:hypothetical protein
MHLDAPRPQDVAGDEAELVIDDREAVGEAVSITDRRLHTHLTFGETGGATATDATGNGHDGTLHGGATRSAGRTGSALALDGAAGSYLSLPDDVVAGLADFTIAVWVNPVASARWARVFDFGAGTGRYMLLTPNGAANAVRFTITTNGRYGERHVDGRAPLPAGRWTHVAVTLSGASATLYVDGERVGSADNVIFAPWRLGPTAQNWLGRSQYGADPAFNGQLDDFRIYHGALSAGDVAALARA